MNEEGLFKQKFDELLKPRLLKIAILVHLGKQGMHPYAMLKHFKNEGWPGFSKLKKSDVYNVIKSLEDEGFIKYRTVKSGARVQKRYELTAKGTRVMKSSKKIISKAFADMRSLLESEFSG